MQRNNLVKIGLWRRLLEDFRLLSALIKDYWKGEYRDVSLGSIAVFVLSIIYVLSPIDTLSDFIPLLGQIDDAFILLFCIFLLEKDLKKYQNWKSNRS
ncbi:MAG: DUF1232 domain-containing protein [Deltaproteobacteria bacterium]|nr:DUF1232 domain-containing protein [Deltaproteobacteria bacterium]